MEAEITNALIEAEFEAIVPDFRSGRGLDFDSAYCKKGIKRGREGGELRIQVYGQGLIHGSGERKTKCVAGRG